MCLLWLIAMRRQQRVEPVEFLYTQQHHRIDGLLKVRIAVGQPRQCRALQENRSDALPLQRTGNLRNGLFDHLVMVLIPVRPDTQRLRDITRHLWCTDGQETVVEQRHKPVLHG